MSIVTILGVPEMYGIIFFAHKKYSNFFLMFTFFYMSSHDCGTHGDMCILQITMSAFYPSPNPGLFIGLFNIILINIYSQKLPKP